MQLRQLGFYLVNHSLSHPVRYMLPLLAYFEHTIASVWSILSTPVPPTQLFLLIY